MFLYPVCSLNINPNRNYDCALATNKSLTAGHHSCTPNAGLAKFKFEPGKVHRLRLINAGAEAQTRFSIDGHNLTVIATDFVPVNPFTVNFVNLAIGQRIDVLVHANGKAGDAYWMRSDVPNGGADPSNPASTAPLCSLANQPVALAAVYYDGPSTNYNAVPKSKPFDVTIASCDVVSFLSFTSKISLLTF
jgi:FtsP/CotA-like multicopper oxidase with cupredoxin domain